MSNHIPSISDATRSAIRGHIIESEERIDWPYLDIKGNVTIGVGFKTDTEDDFAKLDLHIRKDGKLVPATDTEKRHAFKQMQDEKEKRGGNLNVNANDYKDITNIQMLPPAQDALLDRKISKNVENIKKEVGEDAWNKLNDSQKAAVTDIRYANGSLDRFDNLKDAIKAEDAKKMADESTFFTNSKTGQRDEGRLRRNFQALSGLSREEADKRLQEALKKNNSLGNATQPGKAPDKPGNAGGSSGDNSTDASGNGKNQSARAAGNEPEDFTTEQRELMDDITKSDGPLDEILAKDPGDLTEDEVRKVALARMDLPLGPEQEALGQFEKAFFADKFGTGPVQFDAVGRMIEPEPVKPINTDPVPARTVDGEPLKGALKRIGRAVAHAAGDDGRAGAVQGLQSGLNILKRVLDQNTGTPGPGPDQRKSPRSVPVPIPELKTDGVAGPKTRQAVRFAVSRLGAPRVAEGLALGRFNQFAGDVHAGRADGRDLGKTMETAFGPLFRSPERTERPGPMPLPAPGREPRPGPVPLPTPGREGEPDATGGRRHRPAHEAFALQDTINDLGTGLLGGDSFRPIREDGDIGEVTRTAFNTVLHAARPDRFTSRLGHNLGFFDFEDIA